MVGLRHPLNWCGTLRLARNIKVEKFHVDQRESLTPKNVVASASRECSRRILGLRPNGRRTIPHRYRLMASYTLPKSGVNHRSITYRVPRVPTYTTLVETSTCATYSHCYLDCFSVALFSLLYITIYHRYRIIRNRHRCQPLHLSGSIRR